MQKKVLSLIVFFVSTVMVLCACQAPIQQKNEDLISNVQKENIQDLFDENSNTTASPTTSNTQNDDETMFLDWKTAYLDFIERREINYGRESDYGFDYRYALVYIDNDDIPELYAMGVCEADGDLICSYKNGRIIEQSLARMCGGKYVERSGIFINQNGHMGRYYDRVYKLDETGFSQILNASYTERYVPLGDDPLGDDEYEIINEYFIDGKSVTKDEYNVAVNTSVDLSQTVEFYVNSVSYDVIKQQIADCEWENHIIVSQ